MLGCDQNQPSSINLNVIKKRENNEYQSFSVFLDVNLHVI